MDKQTWIILIAIVGASLIYGITANFLNSTFSPKKESTQNVSTVTPTLTPVVSSAPTATITKSPISSPTKAQIPSFLRSDDDDEDRDD